MPTPTSKTEALDKLRRYCAYQERCHREVRTKLLDLGLRGDDLETIIAALVEENFLNEERFARSFSRGKFHIKHWGRNRIRQELKMRDVPDYCIRKALEEIEETEYRATLEAILVKRAEKFTGLEAFALRHKLAQFAVQRGFEAELAWQVLDEMGMTDGA